jgi:hypothetical protein
MTPQEKIAKLEGQLSAVLQAYSILEEYTCMLVDDTEENKVITKANSIVQIAMNDELNN